MNDSEKVRSFQDILIARGWLDESAMNAAGEYGCMGDVSYAAIYDVQVYYMENVMGGKVVRYVRDENGSYKDGSGRYYEIDETTYDFIMKYLPDR